LITIATLKNAWYFVGSVSVPPNTLVTCDEVLFTVSQLEQLLHSLNSDIIALTYTHTQQVKNTLLTKKGYLSENNFRNINGTSVLGYGSVSQLGDVS
jgi:hypothetical protein